MQLEHLFFIAISGLIVLLLWRHFNLVIRAENQVKRHLHREKLTLLDQSVLFKRYRVSLKRGQIAILSEYQFEFSSIGDQRYKGHIRLKNGQLQDIKLPPYKVDELAH